MSGGRAVLAALAGGLAVGTYLQAWVGWPTFVAVAVGAAMTVLILLIAAAVGEDDAAADAAWRTAAPDIAGRDPGRSPAQRPAAGAERGSRDEPD